MKSPQEKYMHDPNYKVLVDKMISMIRACQYTPSELREASLLASIIEAETSVRPLINVGNIKNIEEALSVINSFALTPQTEVKDEGRTKI